MDLESEYDERCQGIWSGVGGRGGRLVVQRGGSTCGPEGVSTVCLDGCRLGVWGGVDWWSGEVSTRCGPGGRLAVRVQCIPLLCSIHTTPIITPQATSFRRQLPEVDNTLLWWRGITFGYLPCGASGVMLENKGLI